MKEFAKLFQELDSSNATSKKVAAMAEYFKRADPRDAAWALYFLTGRKLLRLIPMKVLREAAMNLSDTPPWLFEESYASVGDLAETIALLLPPAQEDAESLSLDTWVREKLMPLREKSPEDQRADLLSWWRTLNSWEVFVLNKLVTGSFRAGVSQGLVIKALSRHSGLTEASLAHRLMGKWDPTEDYFGRLIAAGENEKDPGLPYPFYLASPLEEETETLGDIKDWQLEWKWDGIRAQAIKRKGAVFLWSRGEELITERFPEITEAISRLPQETVLDGEILAFIDGKVAPFSLLQTRIARKNLTEKIKQSVPVILMVYDILEENGKDLRELPLKDRRVRLENLLAKQKEPLLRLSPEVTSEDWKDLATLRETSRERLVEGLMLKRRESPYRVGRKRGDWWKWKVDPHTMDAVLIYAQPGHGRRATLYTDYTFAIWKEKELVPIAKAYSGLTDPEILELDRWIRKHTTEKFGPVRKVAPEIVFELAFEGIAPSPRHKAGLAVRFPRILRRREDKKPQDADSVDSVKRLLNVA